MSTAMRDVPGASAATRQRILQAAEEIGYRPDTRARLLRSNRRRLIGVTFGVRSATGVLDVLRTAGLVVPQDISVLTILRDRRRRSPSGLDGFGDARGTDRDETDARVDPGDVG